MHLRVILLLIAVSSALTFAQKVAPADYARAERFLAYHTDPLVLRSGIRANWIAGGDSFWYRVTVSTPDGAEFVVVDPVKRTKLPAFDHAKVASALAAAVGGTAKYDATHLPFQEIELADAGQSIIVSASAKRWK